MSDHVHGTPTCITICIYLNEQHDKTHDHWAAIKNRYRITQQHTHAPRGATKLFRFQMTCQKMPSPS